MPCLATVVETPRAYSLGRLSPQQITALKSLLAERESYKRGTGGPERRSEVRVPTNEAAQMKALQPLGPIKEVRVLDISRNGLKIRAPEMLLPGTVVQILLKATVAFGEIRFCTPSGQEFHAGVRLQDVFWTHSAK